MAELHGAAGRDELAGDGNAQRPHERRILYAELLGERDEHIVKGAAAPLGKRFEPGQHLAEHVERDRGVGLGLLVGVAFRVIVGKAVEEIDLFGNIGQLFTACLQERRNLGNGIGFVFDSLTNVRCSYFTESIGRETAQIVGVEIGELFDIEDRRRFA